MKLIFVLAATVLAYDLATQQPLAQRQQLCLTNESQCKNFCAGNPSVNTCDPATCKWSCTCASTGQFPTVQPVGAFAIEIEQCNNELLDCVSSCLVNISPDNNFCTATCKSQKQCGTAKASQIASFYVPQVDAPAATSDPSSADYVKLSVAVIVSAFLALNLN